MRDGSVSAVEKTVRLATIHARLSALDYDARQCFEDFPLEEVREHCLVLIEDRMAPDAFTEWTERVISELVRQKDKLWERLLGWYIFKARRRFIKVQAIEFAISLVREGHAPLPVISKIVLNKIKDEPNLYWDVPSMPWFLEEHITRFTGVDPKVVFFYSEEDWSLLERAIRRIAQVQDISFRTPLTPLAAKHRRGDVRPEKEKSDEFTCSTHTAFLEAAERILDQAYVEQTESLYVGLQRFLERCGIREAVNVHVEYPSRVTRGLTEGVAIRVRLERKGSENQFAPAIFDRFVVWFRGEGFLDLRPFGVELLPDRPIAHRKNLESEGTCEFLVFPSKGTNRFWLTLCVEWTRDVEFAKTAGYIYCE